MVRTLRYDARLNAQIVLEAIVIEDWEAGDNREFTSRTNDNTSIVVYPERREVKLSGDDNLVPGWEARAAELLGTVVAGNGVEPAFIDPSIFDVNRAYVKKLGIQINACYVIEAYDAVAVLMRRMLETLLIECFEAKGIDAKIKKPDDTFHMLDIIIARAEAEHADPAGAWNLGRKCRDALPEVKETGDSSAHARRFNARKADVDRLQHRFRVAVEELIQLSGIDAV